MKKCCLFLVFFLFVSSFRSTSAQTLTPEISPSDSEASDLQNKINDLQGKISALQGEEKTLSSQISVMDNQVNLTELRIASAKKQIKDLSLGIDASTKKISKVENSLNGITKILINRISATYMAGSASSFQVLLSSADISDFITKANYLRIAQAHDKKLIYDTVQARNDYANQKDIFEEKKAKTEQLQADLTAYSTQLESEKEAKSRLLSETQGSEATYQTLLAQAKAQLAGFSNFAQSQGGASILSNQTVCDDWGCYYNQRDSGWGNNPLNGTGYTLASDGCLVTAMAMIYSHYGHKSVNPQTINSNSSNFASYFPAYLNKVISADGVTTSRISADIEGTLASGNPVVVGISYDGGPVADHFVVFVSGSGGNYIMKDPFTPNGNNIDFRGRYPDARIVEYEKVVF